MQDLTLRFITRHLFMVEVAPFHVGFDREQDAGAGLDVGRMTRRSVELHAQCADDLENGGEARIALTG